MGAIQNSINQALGSVAGAAIGIKHAKEQEFTAATSAESQAIVAQGQAQTATDEADKLYHAVKQEGGLVERLSEADVNYEMASAAADKAARRKNASMATVLEKRSQAEKAKIAFEALKDEYDSVIGMMNRAGQMREHAMKMTGIASERKAKYSRRWGGKI